MRNVANTAPAHTTGLRTPFGGLSWRTDGNDPGPWSARGIGLAAFGMACYLAAVPLSRMTVFPEVGLAMMWFPPAVFVGLMARRPYSWLPLFIPVAAASEFIAAVGLQDIDVGPALVWVVADTLDMTACAVLARATGAYRLRRPSDFMKFLGIVPAVMLVTSFIGAAGATWQFGGSYASSYVSWVIGSTFGILVVAPMFMRFRVSAQMSLVGPIETTLLIVLVGIVAVISFLSANSLSQFAIDSYLLLPVTVWLALRVGMNLTAIVVPISVYIGSFAAANELGLAATQGVGLSAYSETAAFMVALALTSYAVATVAEAQSDSVRELRLQATTDSVTGLPNRRAVLERLDEIVQTSGPVTLVLIDIVGFQHINDSLGHTVGDQLLRVAGHRLVAVAAPPALVARISGDEFVIIQTDLSEQSSRELAEHLRATLNDPIDIADRLLTIDADCGIAVATSSSQVPQLLSNADIALMSARRAMGASVRMFSPEIEHRHTQENQARTLIHRALDHDGVVIHLQPVFNTPTGDLAGAEALMRLADADGVVHVPGDFIKVAEATGLIVPLGRVVLRQSLSWVREHAQTWQGLHLAVNAAVPELADPHYVPDLLALLAEMEVPTAMLVVEVTEHTLLDLGPRAVSTLDELRAAGVKIALDDFGTGYSSISALRGLPIDIIKIDRSFVSGLPDEPGDVAIVRAVRNLARDFGLTTVAEGVETPEQRAMLHAMGVEQLQGYLLGRPCPPAEFVVKHLPQVAQN